MKNEQEDFLNLEEAEFLQKINQLGVVEKEEMIQQRQLWLMMKAIPEPEISADVSHNFYEMLNSFELNQKASFWKRISDFLRRFKENQSRFYLAYSLGILLIGMFSGLLIDRTFFADTKEREMAELSAEVKEMKEMVMLSLLENPSASERIKAVSLTEDIPNVDQKVINALFTTLNNDENDNVRIMTLEALATLADDPVVREGLIASITLQESPLVQSAMADVMVMLQEKKAVEGFKELLRKKDLNQGVKMKIEQSMSEIL